MTGGAFRDYLRRHRPNGRHDICYRCDSLCDGPGPVSPMRLIRVRVRAGRGLGSVALDVREANRPVIADHPEAGAMTPAVALAPRDIVAQYFALELAPRVLADERRRQRPEGTWLAHQGFTPSLVSRRRSRRTAHRARSRARQSSSSTWIRLLDCWRSDRDRLPAVHRLRLRAHEQVGQPLLLYDAGAGCIVHRTRTRRDVSS